MSEETIKIYFDPDTGETFMKIDGMPPQKCENVTKDLIKLQGAVSYTHLTLPTIYSV